MVIDMLKKIGYYTLLAFSIAYFLAGVLPVLSALSNAAEIVIPGLFLAYFYIRMYSVINNMNGACRVHKSLLRCVWESFKSYMKSFLVLLGGVLDLTAMMLFLSFARIAALRIVYGADASILEFLVILGYAFLSASLILAFYRYIFGDAPSGVARDAETLMRILARFTSVLSFAIAAPVLQSLYCFDFEAVAKIALVYFAYISIDEVACITGIFRPTSCIW